MIEGLRPGVRIRLLEMPDDPAAIEPGATGTVTFVERDVPYRGCDQVGVDWDNGRRLNLVVPPDRFEVLG